MDFLENKTGEITVRTYLLSITEIVNSVQQTGTGVLLIVNNYILDLQSVTNIMGILKSLFKKPPLPLYNVANP